VLPDRLRQQFRELSLSVDAMTTGAAVRTYNILLAENRRVGAGLIRSHSPHAGLSYGRSFRILRRLVRRLTATAISRRYLRPQQA
jgi:hypothetical protein